MSQYQGIMHVSYERSTLLNKTPQFLIVWNTSYIFCQPLRKRYHIVLYFTFGLWHLKAKIHFMLHIYESNYLLAFDILGLQIRAELVDFGFNFQMIWGIGYLSRGLLFFFFLIFNVHHFIETHDKMSYK